MEIACSRNSLTVNPLCGRSIYNNIIYGLGCRDDDDVSFGFDERIDLLLAFFFPPVFDFFSFGVIRAVRDARAAGGRGRGRSPHTKRQGYARLIVRVTSSHVILERIMSRTRKRVADTL